MRSTGRILLHGALIAALTVVTQIGGIAWLLALMVRRRVLAFMGIYLAILASDPRVGRILVEPHLVRSWSAAHPNIGFQGCRAARHE